MSQDYTVAKELASLKEIKQSAEQRISELSLNALNYVNDHRLHKESGGNCLPEVTAEDNGDVLTVVDGEWSKAAPSGGGGGLLVVLADEETDAPSWLQAFGYPKVYETNVTTEQLIAAVESSVVSISEPSVLTRLISRCQFPTMIMHDEESNVVHLFAGYAFGCRAGLVEATQFELVANGDPAIDDKVYFPVEEAPH